MCRFSELFPLLLQYIADNLSRLQIILAPHLQPFLIRLIRKVVLLLTVISRIEASRRQLQRLSHQTSLQPGRKLQPSRGVGGLVNRSPCLLNRVKLWKALQHIRRIAIPAGLRYVLSRRWQLNRSAAGLGCILKRLTVNIHGVEF